MQITYNTPGLAGYAAAVALNTSTETDLVTISNNNFLSSSQITVYYRVTLGSATKADFRYYVSPDDGSTWYQVPIQDPTDGVLENIPNAAIDSSTYSSASVSYAIHDIPMSSCKKFKITGKSTTAAATVDKIHVFVRDN